MNIIKPSQWINVGSIFVAIAMLFMGSIIGPYHWLSPLIPVWKYIETYYTRYEIYEDKIVFRRGVFRVLTDEILFYRIKAITMDEPLLYRIVGIATIKLRTSDKYVGELDMVALPVKGMNFVNQLRDRVEQKRKENGVKEFDMFNL